MAIFRTIESINYPFLHDATMICDIFTDHAFQSIYMDRSGGICLKLKGKIDKELIKRIMCEFDPYVTSETSFDDYNPEYYEDYEYSDEYTLFYSKEGIDYRTPHHAIPDCMRDTYK